MGAVAVGLIGFFIFIMLRLSAPHMEMLYTDLTLEDSSAVVAELESRNIQYELRNEGGTVLVPKEDMLRMRLALAADGLPAGGAVGYEIFNSGDTLGATSFVQNINHLRALEGELARTIRALDKVRMARVHLVLPQRELFSRDTPDPSASIVVRTRSDLGPGEIRAIQHLVASAVKELRPTSVAIVDESGRLLASGDDSTGAVYGNIEERGLAIEQRMEQQLHEIIASVVGPDSARVQVAAELDFNRVTQTSDVFDPESQVVRSTQTKEQISESTQQSRDDAVSVANELPAADGTAAEGGAASNESNNLTEEVVNYEISRTTTTEVLEAGRIKRLSVAVLVDGTYTQAEDGTVSYTPRPQEELDQIATLVRSAIGFDRARGDQVEVVNLRFAPDVTPDALAAEEAGFFNFTKEDYFYFAELAVLLIVSLLVLLFVVRPLIRRIVTPEDRDALLATGADGAQASLPGSEPVAQLTGPQGETLATSPDRADAVPTESETSSLIDATQVIGARHEASLQKIGDLVQRNPDEAISIIRQWLSEKAA